MKWLLVALIVFSTAIGDVLQSRESKRHGEVRDFRPSRLGRWLAGLIRRRYLLLAVVFMAVSFFSFLQLLSIADLSFAVPVTAASFVIETILAKYFLREKIDWKRWTGTCLVACGVALLAL